jgi:uncharacterized membrane protein YvbJ
MTEVGQYCSECGAKLPEPTSKFCPNCGKPTALASDADKTRRAADVPDKTMTPSAEGKEKKKGKSKKVKNIVGVVIAVIFIFIILPLIVSYGEFVPSASISPILCTFTRNCGASS